MGDESKQNEVEQGNLDPLHSTRKPSTAEQVDEEPSELAQMPTAGETDHRADEKRRKRRP